MAKPDLGTKRQCLSCGAKYYDLGKDPATCPRCGAIFQAPALLRARSEPKQADEEDTETELDAPEMISLEEADAEDAVKDPVIDDVEIEDDIDADDDFDAINRLYMERGWGDGLPIVPPTAERVEAMLEYCDRPIDKPIAKMAPRYGEATPLRLAANEIGRAHV